MSGYERKARSYKEEIARGLNLSISEVEELSILEVDKLFEEKHQKEVSERMKTDVDNYKRIQLLLDKDYPLYVQYLGDSFLEALCQIDLSLYLEPCPIYGKMPDFNEEQKKYLVIEASSSKYGYYGNRCSSYYKLRMPKIADAVADAIWIKYPMLKEYEPSIAYSYNGFSSFVTFHLPRKSSEGEKEEEFYCSLESFFNKDIDSMIEDFLQKSGFNDISEKDSQQYVNFNCFFNLEETKRFLEIIKNLN